MADLPIPELVENGRRSVAMLAPGAPALNRDEALEVPGQGFSALAAEPQLVRILVALGTTNHWPPDPIGGRPIG